jgi:hypothetical protein
VFCRQQGRRGNFDGQHRNYLAAGTSNQQPLLLQTAPDRQRVGEHAVPMRDFKVTASPPPSSCSRNESSCVADCSGARDCPSLPFPAKSPSSPTWAHTGGPANPLPGIIQRNRTNCHAVQTERLPDSPSRGERSEGMALVISRSSRPVGRVRRSTALA